MSKRYTDDAAEALILDIDFSDSWLISVKLEFDKITIVVDANVSRTKMADLDGNEYSTLNLVFGSIGNLKIDIEKSVFGTAENDISSFDDLRTSDLVNELKETYSKSVIIEFDDGSIKVDYCTLEISTLEAMKDE